MALCFYQKYDFFDMYEEWGNNLFILGLKGWESEGRSPHC